MKLEEIKSEWFLIEDIKKVINKSNLDTFIFMYVY